MHMLKRNRIKCNEVWIVLCCDKLNYVFYSLIDEEYQFCNTACTYKFITAKLFTLTGFWNNFHLYVIKYSPDGKIFHIKFLAINEVYIFHSMHKLFAQWALRGKSVVSVNHIQCGQPLPNLTEMCELLCTQAKSFFSLFPPDVMDRLQHYSLYFSPFV